MISSTELLKQFEDMERERGIAIEEICEASSPYGWRLHIKGDCIIPAPFYMPNKEES
jgi:hypothetical protein